MFGVDFVALLVIVCGLLWGHCMTGLRVSLLDNVVTCLDVNTGAFTTKNHRITDQFFGR